MNKNKQAVSIILDDRFTNTLTSKFELTKYRLDHIDLDEERTEILDKSTWSHSMFDTVLPSASMRKKRDRPE